MLRSDGTVKVADFGIAKIISSASTTMTGAVMGTPSYMSPEQIEARDVDGRSDQFALAVLAFEIISGVKPFKGESIAAIAHLIVYGERPSPHEFDPALPLALDQVFQRAFARLPEQRFATCTAFAEALENAFRKASAPNPAPPTVRQEHVKTSRSINVFAGAALIFAAIGGAAFYFYRQPKPATPRRSPRAPLWNLKLAHRNTGRTTPPSGTPTIVGATAPPVIKQFRADPDSVKTGSPAMLVWEVSGADKVTIDHGIGKVAAKGMFAVVPSVSTTYSISASDAAGTTHRNVSIEVTADPESVPMSVRARQVFTEAQTKRRAGQTEEAATLFARSAEMGDSGAMVELGEMYSSGEGVTEDEGKAFNWFKRAAEAGNVAGMVALGGMDLLGVNGADPNEEEAARWFQKAAEHDSPAALFDLGTLYESGRGVGKNLDKAKTLYQKAAKLGNREAEKRLVKLGVAPIN